jgi:hypothetical protein
MFQRQNALRTSWLLCASLVVAYGILPVYAQEEQGVPAPTSPPTALAIPQWDPEELARRIPGWLEVWNDPPDPDREAVAVSALFGDPLDGTAFIPPAWLKRRLVAKRLGYASWQAREAAAQGFGTLLVHEPHRLLPILRDALNDPHQAVREEAIIALNNVLIYEYEEKLDAAEKPAERRKWRDHCDEIIDMLIDKGLGDENEEVAQAAVSGLKFVWTDPTSSRLRSLERRIARGTPLPFALDEAKRIRSKWLGEERDADAEPRPSPRPPATTEDPFAG